MTVMWIIFAFASALFASLTSILAKCGIKKTDSTVATAIRTIVVLIMAVITAAISGSLGLIGDIGAKTRLFLILSGLATGASWLCYFRALQSGEVNKVVPIDKSSVILTLILAFIFLDDKITLLNGVCIVLIGAGTFLMIEKKETDSDRKKDKRPTWILYAVLSAVFASLTSILGKIGIDGVESNLGTAIRTAVVLVMAWVMVFVTGKGGEIKHLTFEDTEYGPEFEPLAEIFVKYDMSPVIICESSGTQAEDAMTMRRIYDSVKKSL